MKLVIDLDKETELPKLTALQGLVDIKKNGKWIVKNSVLEDIDTFSEEELAFIFTKLKPYLSPIVTSVYIPSTKTMEVMKKLAPEFMVRFKTEKPGANKIMPISPEAFFEGETIFQSILEGMQSTWTEQQQYRYLYQQTGIWLSYDLNVLSHTPNARVHEEYARNLFTSIAKNWGICTSFAAMYDYLCYRSGLESAVLSEEEHDYVMLTDAEDKDYLTDPTQDATKLKFGLKTESYAVSKEKFTASHHLQEAGVEDYDFATIGEDALEALDKATGYLDNFGGAYTNETLSKLADALEGNTIEEKVVTFMEKVKALKTVGRPTDSDYVSIMKWILEKSTDRNFAENLEIDSVAYEDTKELPRKVIVKVNTGVDATKKYYTFEPRTKNISEMNEKEWKELSEGIESIAK